MNIAKVIPRVMLSQEARPPGCSPALPAELLAHSTWGRSLCPNPITSAPWVSMWLSSQNLTGDRATKLAQGENPHAEPKAEAVSAGAKRSQCPQRSRAWGDGAAWVGHCTRPSWPLKKMHQQCILCAFFFNILKFFLPQPELFWFMLFVAGSSLSPSALSPCIAFFLPKINAVML